MIPMIQDNLNTLITSFSDFKNRQDERLMHLDTLIQKSVQRIEKMELLSQRPSFSNHPPLPEVKEFTHFVRKGLDNFSTKSLTAEKDGEGGYLVPFPIIQLIHEGLNHTSIIRQLASQTTITSDSLDLLLEKKEAEAGWVSETGDRAETGTPEFVKIRIPVHQIYAKPRASQKLLDDSSIPIDQWISEKIAQQFAKIESEGFLFGDGNGKPQGILTAETCSLDKQEWGKVSTLKTGVKDGFKDSDDLLKGLYSLESKYLPGASWVMPRSVAFQIAQMKNQAGQYIWQHSFSTKHPNTLLGYPVYLCDDMVKQNVPHRIIFGNLKDAYHVVDRSNMSLLRDPFSSKPYVEFYATKRVGGSFINYNAIKYIDLSQAE